MTKKTLQSAVTAAKEETKLALQTVQDALNNGQRKKLRKNAEVAALFDRWGVQIGEEDP